MTATAEEAARAYDVAALAQWGWFARTNFHPNAIPPGDAESPAPPAG